MVTSRNKGRIDRLIIAIAKKKSLIESFPEGDKYYNPNWAIKLVEFESSLARLTDGQQEVNAGSGVVGAGIDVPVGGAPAEGV